MKNLLIRSFGNADIYFDNHLLEHYHDWIFEKLSFVEKVDLLVQDFDTYKEKIQFLMVDIFFEQYADDLVYDFVWIFTKQDNIYNYLDTYGLYALFSKYIQYKQFSNIALFKENDQIILYDAFDEEKIFNIMQVSLSKIFDEIDHIWYQKVQINITWGTKIMTLLTVYACKSIFHSIDFQLYYGLRNKATNNTSFITIDRFIKDC